MPPGIELAVAKTHKFGTRESGDTAEVVERPGGGVSLVVVDGQGSGAPAKRLSLMVTGKVISLLSEGVRDGAVARAAHDYLFAQRGGRVSCALDIVSVDLATQELVITRNSEVPMLLQRCAGLEELTDASGRIGLYPRTRPSLLRFPAEPGLVAVVASDGVALAGRHFGHTPGLMALAAGLSLTEAPANQLADTLLQRAIAADQGHPRDDMTVAVIRLVAPIDEYPVRRLEVSLPLQA
ncbi:MAG TPA: SpoIIE family protein phosphatase [Thermomicrobiaceae bacterium]|nr:SpoIIE family protein phosphatase [Thermomicrobiaceae bacterium]